MDKIIFKLNRQISTAPYGRSFRGVMHISRIRHRRPFRSDESHAEVIRCVRKGARLGGGVYARQKSSSSCNSNESVSTVLKFGVRQVLVLGPKIFINYADVHHVPLSPSSINLVLRRYIVGLVRRSGVALAMHHRVLTTVVFPSTGSRPEKGR